jgi:hypothetical protein
LICRIESVHHRKRDQLLAFPDVSDAMVVFGAGYGFDNLAAAPWLHEKQIYYWGDIDTHGLPSSINCAVLASCRFFSDGSADTSCPQGTVGVEMQPETGTLTRLNSEESALTINCAKIIGGTSSPGAGEDWIRLFA